MDSREDRQLAWLMLAAFALLFVPAWFSRGPWHVDDLRYVEAARQMGEYGDFLVPRLNGELYGQKPPGYSWAVVATHYVTTADYLVAARIVSALAALLTGLMLVHLARLLFGSPAIGWLGAGLLWTFIFILDRGTRSLIDSFLYMWTTLGVLTLLRAALAGNWRARAGWIAATVGALGCGCVVKGPVALAIPALGACTLGLWWKGRSGVSFTALVVGTLAGGALTLLWLWQASLVAGPEYLDSLLFDQIKGRVMEQGEERAVATNAHAKPVWFFLLTIPPVALPWLLFLPGSARAAWRNRFSPQGRAALGLLAWAGAIFVFFSLISGKRAGYVLPLFPPLALALAWGMTRMQIVHDRRLLGIPAALLVWAAPLAGGLVALAGVLLALFPAQIREALPAGAQEITDGLSAVRLSVLIAAGVIALLWGSMALSVLRRSALAATMLVIPFIGIISATAHLTLVPAMDTGLSAATFGQAVDRQWPRHERLVELGGQKDGIVTYYCGVQRVELLQGEDPPQTYDLLAQQHGTLWLVCMRKDWDRMPVHVRIGFHERAAAWFNGKEYVLAYRP